MTAAMGVQRLTRIRLIAAQPQRLAGFYEAAFGFSRAAQMFLDDTAFAQLMGIPGATAEVVVLRLGGEEIEIAGIHPHGRDVAAAAGWSPLFQHCAIVASDMAAAYARLCAQSGWRPISTQGPQLLPAASGGVRAFKFRDPEGHPLELLAFPPAALPDRWKTQSSNGCLGIDHSAISIVETERSIAFYRRLGLNRIGGSLNLGPAQDKLDDVSDAEVEVTALAPRREATPHLELLCYRGSFPHDSTLPSINDGAATQLVLSVADEDVLQAFARQNRQALLSGPLRCNDGYSRGLFRDPDGHLLCIECRR